MSIISSILAVHQPEKKKERKKHELLLNKTH